MTRSRQWVVLSLTLLLLGGLLMAYKVVRLGFPLLPDERSEQWVVQARVEIEPLEGSVRARLLLPARSSGFIVSAENFISRGFGLTLDEALFRREANWAIRRLYEPKTLYYRATVIPDNLASNCRSFSLRIIATSLLRRTGFLTCPDRLENLSYLFAALPR